MARGYTWLPADTGTCTPRHTCTQSGTPAPPRAGTGTGTGQGPTAAGGTYRRCQQYPSYLVVLDEALAPGANVCAPALTRSVVEYLKNIVVLMLSQLIFLQKNPRNDEGLVA